MYHYLETQRIRFFEMRLLSDAYFRLGFDTEENETVRLLSVSRVTICLDGLEATRLVHRHTELELAHSEIVDREIPSYSFTDRGLEFIQTCRPPKLQK
jgi:hypothetical protein